MSAQSDNSKFKIRSFVVRAGRITPAQQRAYDSLSGKFLVPFSNALTNFSTLFDNNTQQEIPVIVEIGFGMGEATALIAAANPDKYYLGIEVHKPGIGKLLHEIEQCSLSNIRIIEHDAVDVIEQMIPPGSLAGIHLFFPDPWPKKRHHKRRLITRPFTHKLASCLKPGAYLYMVTDWADYANWALTELSVTDMLANTCEGFALPQEWRPRTAFERKGLAKNHEVRELLFKRI